ncbi:MAG: SDR family oxidoreductase [Roseiflexaceae bacterium]|nr:SDR family oxidoreductase [Roseiflexaceae bacterium]
MFMMLQDKVAVVTGVNREIGLAMAEELAGAGARVLAAHFGEAERVMPLVERVRAAGGTIELCDADLRVVAECQRVVAEAVRHFGRVDLLAANAGLSLGHPFLEEDEATIDTLFSLNLKGAFFCAQAAARQMVAQGIGAGQHAPYRIVFTASVTGVKAAPGMAGYAVTKAGVRHLATTLAVELGQYGITVNAIAPGAVLNERNLADHPDYAARWAALTPVGRVGQPRDIAAALRFLVSDQAEWLSGQTLIVDGGWSVQGLH